MYVHIVISNVFNLNKHFFIFFPYKKYCTPHSYEYNFFQLNPTQSCPKDCDSCADGQGNTTRLIILINVP